MIKIKNITKRYRRGTAEFTALENFSLSIQKGEYIAVTGPSGAGKSTLLNSIGGLIHPDSGEILYNGRDIYKQNSKFTDEYRRKHVGFMFQQFHLMPYLTVLDNIKLACYEKAQFDKIADYLERCSLTGLKNKYPSELSVGEKQRTAFIRAIISNPDILLADEPTGNLDPDNSRILMSLVEEFHQKGGTVVLVSHDPLTTKYTKKVIVLNRLI